MAGQPPSEVDEPLPLFVPDREGRPKADLVVEETIGSHLCATAFAGPTFRGADESTTDSPPPDVSVNVPALDVADRARVARVGMGADRRLHEPREASTPARGNVGHGSFPPAGIRPSLRGASRGSRRARAPPACVATPVDRPGWRDGWGAPPVSVWSSATRWTRR